MISDEKLPGSKLDKQLLHQLERRVFLNGNGCTIDISRNVVRVRAGIVEGLGKAEDAHDALMMAARFVRMELKLGVRLVLQLFYTVVS